jgi:hypothetical protein
MNDKDFETLQELGCFKQHPLNSNLSCNVAGSKQLKQEPYYETLMIIEGILDIGFDPSNKEKPFCPQSSCSWASSAPAENEKRIWEEVRQHPSWEPGCNYADIDGSYMLRSPLPKDLSAQQAQILYRNLDKVESYYLKAKIADVLWESMRLGKYGIEVAKIVAETYFNSVYYAFESKDKDGFKHAVWFLVRASVIMAKIEQYDECFDKLMKFFERKELFEGDEGCDLLKAIGNSALKLNNLSSENRESIATKYKEIFENIKPAFHYVLDESNVWSIGAELSKKAKMPEYKDHFNMEKAKAHLEAAKMAYKFSGPDYNALSNRQYHLKEAIRSLRNIEKKDESIKEMIELARTKLVETEKQIPNSTRTTVEWRAAPKEYHELLQKEFSGLNFEKCLSKFVNLYNDALITNYEYVKYYKPGNPLLAALSEKGHIQEVDGNGKVVSNSNGDSIWLDALWQSLNGSLIKPILEIIKNEHLLFSEEAIHNLIKGSSFIPEGHYEIFAKGINYFLHGQILEALFLLVLQVENCLRYVLYNEAGINTNIVKGDGTEKNKIDIEELLGLCQENGILDEKIVFYLKDFLVKSNLSLRNQIAHEVSDNIANDTAAYPCCALILFLVLKRTGNAEIKCNENEKLGKYLSDFVKMGISVQKQSWSKLIWEQLTQMIRDY